ncbi:Hypothetical protein SMAX5B_006172 [Scophthalmus maximus]|uniref:Uncharacterized protein n=1 Tax=Scophthalmus maximus TaxID=52904 RepID=A0A2U9BJA3_SCOMX|nr:Hypothetical protein SMAX5B_006172 [Scophthalmus maximus]
MIHLRQHICQPITIDNHCCYSSLHNKQQYTYTDKQQYIYTDKQHHSVIAHSLCNSSAQYNVKDYTSIWSQSFRIHTLYRYSRNNTARDSGN